MAWFDGEIEGNAVYLEIKLSTIPETGNGVGNRNACLLLLFVKEDCSM